MYSDKERSLVREQFWAAFGVYIAPVFSAEGQKINWVNYKTGLKDIRFVLEVENDIAYIGMAFRHPDPYIQDLQFEKLLQFKTVFEQTVGESWQWERKVIRDGKMISHVYMVMQGPSIMNRANWPVFISFFKPKIIAMDQFWSNYKFAFEA